MQAYGVLPLDKAEEVLLLMAEPLVAMCTVRWIHLYVTDPTLNSKEAFLTLLPVFCQLLATVASHHARQWQDCFEVLKV